LGNSSQNKELKGIIDSGGSRVDMSNKKIDPRLCITVPEAAKLLGVSRNYGYDLAKRGKIPVLKFGSRVLVPKVPFEKMLNDCSIAKDGSNERSHIQKSSG
jgi:excisionase family DNA binding protein